MCLSADILIKTLYLASRLSLTRRYVHSNMTTGDDIELSAGAPAFGRRVMRMRSFSDAARHRRALLESPSKFVTYSLSLGRVVNKLICTVLIAGAVCGAAKVA